MIMGLGCRGTMGTTFMDAANGTPAITIVRGSGVAAGAALLYAMSIANMAPISNASEIQNAYSAAALSAAMLVSCENAEACGSASDGRRSVIQPRAFRCGVAF
jgi:hypothetical protein